MIPIILRTDHVVLEGNRFFPVEMKILARQIRETLGVKLDTIVLTNCQVN